jgi:tRNA dimethylallyltransferase
MHATRPKVIVVAGPTASGKSALALRLAETFDGVVINADSQQCYRDLSILTARPTAADEARVPHRLFATLGPTERDSAAAWAARAAREIEAATAAGRRPVVVGGTGLYLQALMIGMPAMPAIPAAARAAAKALLADLDHADFHRRLVARDPGAARLMPGDTQRILRAWEVIEATGRPLSAWQADPPVVPTAADFFPILLLPPRAEVVAAADARFDAMIAIGAESQVADLLKAGVPLTAPVFRVLGSRALAEVSQGKRDRAEAIERGKIATRQYIKRQSTWFRHQFPARLTIHEQFSERILPEIVSKVREWG